MENNDSEINVEKMLESMVNAHEYMEKALECDNEGLRKRIELVSKVLNQFIENPNKRFYKRLYKKMAKKLGMSLEMLITILTPTSIMFKEALSNFDNNELREFIELFVEQSKINRMFFGS